MEVKRVALVLVDISGYTRFITNHIAAVLHAELIITDLMEAVIDKSEYPLTLSKLEGDAAFLYAPLDANPRAEMQVILSQVAAFFDAFRVRERELVACVTCQCEACESIDRLRLKAFLHSGEAVIKKVHQFEELGGADTILLHRLLKNTIPASEYLVMTDSFYELSGGITGSTPESRMEECEGIGSVPIKVYYPPEPTAAPSASPASETELRAMEAAVMERMDERIVHWVTGRGPKQRFSHVKKILTPKTLWPFFLGALAHVKDIAQVIRSDRAEKRSSDKR